MTTHSTQCLCDNNGTIAAAVLIGMYLVEYNASKRFSGGYAAMVT